LKTALIIVDLQNDFLPGGALAVEKGLEVLPVINQLLKMPFDLVVATKDWHPPQHGSFASTHGRSLGDVIDLEGIPQILWPDHCIQGSKGAEFHEGWDSNKVRKVFYKGTEANIDSYSTFFDNGNRKSTGLADYLNEHGIERVFLAGLATDYCVKYSVLDAARLGFITHVVPEGCRGVNLHLADAEIAFEEMKKAGAEITHLKDVEKVLKDIGKE
jgi:nicotinamidase/pyrazinamidase